MKAFNDEDVLSDRPVLSETQEALQNLPTHGNRTKPTKRCEPAALQQRQQPPWCINGETCNSPSGVGQIRQAGLSPYISGDGNTFYNLCFTTQLATANNGSSQINHGGEGQGEGK